MSREDEAFDWSAWKRKMSPKKRPAAGSKIKRPRLRSFASVRKAAKSTRVVR